MLCAHTESVCFLGHSVALDATISTMPLEWTAGSGWRLFPFLSHIATAVRRHRYVADFACAELMPNPCAGDACVPPAAGLSATMRDTVAAALLDAPRVLATM